MAELDYLLPEIILVTFALITPALAYSTTPKTRRALAYWSLAGLLAAFYLKLDLGGFLGPLSLFRGALSIPQTLFEGALRADIFSLLFSFIFIAVAILVVIASLAYIKPEEPHQGEYYALLLTSTVGMMVVAMAMDLIVLFVGLELSTLSTYTLVAFRKKERKGSEAAMKFFVIGALSSALFLYGISLIYGVTGTTSLTAIAAVLTVPAVLTQFRVVLLLAVVFIVGGLGFKIAAVPFHMWVPDTYQGAPDTITTLLAAASKKMGIAAALRIFLIALSALSLYWVPFFGAIAILTMTVGNVAALAQTSVKRMLAYSSIGHAGYMLIALAVATPTAVAGGVYYSLAHAFMKGGAFLVVAVATSLLIGDRLEDYGGLGRRSPFLAVAMTIFLFSLMGIPPLTGFMGKFLVFASAIEAGGFFVWLAIAGILNSAISVYYYARVIRYMHVVSPNPGNGEKIQVSKPMVVAISLALLGTVLLGVYPQPFIDASIQAASALGALP